MQGSLASLAPVHPQPARVSEQTDLSHSLVSAPVVHFDSFPKRADPSYPRRGDTSGHCHRRCTHAISR